MDEVSLQLLGDAMGKQNGRANDRQYIVRGNSWDAFVGLGKQLRGNATDGNDTRSNSNTSNGDRGSHRTSPGTHPLSYSTTRT